MVERALLLIADIGGYTRFMTYHRLNLAHAQDTITQLLEAVIDAAGSLKLAKLEGDAAFFAGPPGASAASRIDAMRQAFLRKRGALIGERMCNCESCMQLEGLKLKFVVHEGELVRHRVKGNEELAGVDVILVHRLLKNDVPIKEYALASDSALHHVAPLGAPQAIAQDLEGIGEATTHYVDLTGLQLEEPEPAPPRGLRRLWKKLLLEVRSVPYLLGLKEACKGFQNLPVAEDGKRALAAPADAADAAESPAALAPVPVAAPAPDERGRAPAPPPQSDR
jgi:hypothetical protein